MKNYLTTGQFAKLCNTTKETLFHYSDIGLLQPIYIAENGYRYYSPKQFYDFTLIRILKNAKMSLEDIRAYFSDYNNREFISMIEEKQKELVQEKANIDYSLQLMESLKASIRTGITEKIQQPKLVYMEPEYISIIKIDEEQNRTDNVEALKEHLNFTQRYNLHYEFPLGSGIIREDFLAGKFIYKFYFSKLKDHKNVGNVHQKSGGVYATILHGGSPETIFGTYKILLRFIKDNKLEIKGNIYEYDLINKMNSRSMSDYVTQISIRVD